MDIRSSRCGLKSKTPLLTHPFFSATWRHLLSPNPPFCPLWVNHNLRHISSNAFIVFGWFGKVQVCTSVAHNGFEAPLNTYSWQITCKMPFSFQIQFSLSAATPRRVRHAELKQPPGYLEICLLTLWSASQFTVRVGHPSLASSAELFPFYFAAALVFERHGLYTNKEKSHFDPIECKDSLKKLTHGQLFVWTRLFVQWFAPTADKLTHWYENVKLA